LPFEKWIFRYGQPVCDDDGRSVLMMTSNKKQHSLLWVAFVLAAYLSPETHGAVHNE